MVKLVTLPKNVPMQKIKIVMMKIAIRKTRVIRSIRKETMEDMPREEISIQRRIATHLMMIQIVTMILERCFSWPWMQKKLLLIMMNLKRREK